MAIPISAITVRTSAKSTFMTPGLVMSSEMPCTAFRSTSLAAAKASISVTVSSRTVSSFWLGMMIRESTCSDSSWIPSSAYRARREPSLLNGRVTTATVRIPRSRAAWAMIGAAPVPVPPPMPAVRNTMSVCSSTPSTVSRSSRAALRPTSGSEPAPRPLVMLEPSCNCVATPQDCNACTSVFAQMNSTPSNAALRI